MGKSLYGFIVMSSMVGRVLIGDSSPYKKIKKKKTKNKFSKFNF